VVYWRKTWSLMLNQKHGLRMSNNSVLRRSLGPWRGQVTGNWRKLCEDGLYNLYVSLNITRVIGQGE